MPTYEYECMHCGHIFEEFQSINDEPLKECPQCGKEVRRLISAGMGIIFKGSGFYVTDNRKGSGSNGKGTSSAKTDSGENSKTGPATKDSATKDKQPLSSASGDGAPKSSGTKEKGS